MTNRREFLRYSSAAAFVATLPALAADKVKVPARLIPGTDESLAVIGLGNSVSFREADLTGAAELLDIFLEHGGGYVDVGGVSRMSVGSIAKSRGAADKLFFGNYVEPQAGAAMRSEVASVAAGQGKSALDLAHTRNLAAYRQSHDLYRALQEEGLVRYIGIARSGADGFGEIVRLVEDGLVDFIQVNYSLAEPQAAERLLPLASVGRIPNSPENSLTVQSPHVPPPPQAEGTKMLLSASTPNEFSADGHAQSPLLVDDDVDGAAGDQPRLGDQDNRDQRQHDAGKHANTDENFRHRLAPTVECRRTP